MVEKGEAIGHVGRMMETEADRCRTEADAIGLAQNASDENLWHDNGLVLHGVVFANPELVEAERLGPDDKLDVLVEALGSRFIQRMERHDEYAGFDQMSVGGHDAVVG